MKNLGGRGRVRNGEQLWKNTTLPCFLLPTWNSESWDCQMSIPIRRRSTERFSRFFRESVSQHNGRALSESLQCPFRVLLPESTSDCRKKTTIKWDSCNPEFNEQVKEMNYFPQYNSLNFQFVFMTNIADLPKQSLSVTVWNHSKGRQHEYIGMLVSGLGVMSNNFIISPGGLILGLSVKGERLRHWASLIKHPNKVHMRTHSLSANFLS